MANDDLLDRIDDIITWHGSRDAMEWTAEPPSPTFRLAVDTEAAQQAFARLGEQVQSIVDACRTVSEQVLRQFSEITQVFTAIVNTPPMRELVQEQQRTRSAMKREYTRRSRRRASEAEMSIG